MVGERMDGQLLSETFVELTDTMVADFDVIDFLQVLTDRSAQLLDVSAAGLLLADQRGELRVVAASSEAARLLELLQVQLGQGPGPAAPSPPPPSVPPPAGLGSPTPPPRLAWALSRRCRCGCASRSSARSTSSAPPRAT